MELDQTPVSFLGRRLPSQFRGRVVVIGAGHKRAYEDAEWRGALVVVERGQVEFEHLDGSRSCFGRGSILWLEGLPLRALHNRGQEIVVLVAVARRGNGREG